MARILLSTFESSGDLNPFMALGLRLRERGHVVRFAVQEHFLPTVEALGFLVDLLSGNILPEGWVQYIKRRDVTQAIAFAELKHLRKSRTPSQEETTTLADLQKGTSRSRRFSTKSSGSTSQAGRWRSRGAKATRRTGSQIRVLTSQKRFARPFSPRIRTMWHAPQTLLILKQAWKMRGWLNEQRQKAAHSHVDRRRSQSGLTPDEEPATMLPAANGYST